MLKAALEAEVQSFLEANSHVVDERGRRQVVRNGYMPERTVATGAGPMDVKQPRVRDRRDVEKAEKIRFTSKILPPYLRRSKSLDELIPWLYLYSISTGDLSEALSALLGTEVKGFSANVVSRLVSTWQEEHEAWTRRDLGDREYVYVWADGVYVNIRLGQDDRQCVLVLMGATKDGRKELIGVWDGVRESEQSWYELLVGLKAQGLQVPPKIAVGDGALGFWKALRKAFPSTGEQRCTVHKTANVLGKLPKSVQPKAKSDLSEIWMAATREDASKAFDTFLSKYDAKYPKATKCLEKDREALLAFYDFPADHWQHLRTTNPIESTFATVRLRHNRTKGNGNRAASLAMVFKLAQAAEKSWRRLNGSSWLVKLADGHTFVDGVLDDAQGSAA